MLIAEALDERKKLRSDLAELQNLPTTYSEDEDEETAKAAATESLEKVEIILSRINELTVAINRRNSQTEVEFEGYDGLTIMEAVVLRDRLLSESRFYDHLVDEQDGVLRGSSYRYGKRRSKEDIAEKPVIERRALIMARDQAAKSVAQLDLAIQKVNWSIEL